MEPLTKEEQSVNVKERLNKEETYALYGAYAPAEAVNSLNGKATKPSQPYDQTIFPGVPAELQNEARLASLKRTPEENLRSVELLNHYFAQDYANDTYTPHNLEAYDASLAMGNAATMRQLAENRINHLRLSREAASSVVKYNQEKHNPKEYAKIVEARAKFGKAADYFGAPEELVNAFEEDYIYSSYYNQLENSKVTLDYLAQMGPAATPDDLKILRRMAASQDESISRVVYDSNFLTNVSWANISDKPTTVSGYGITDAVDSNTLNSSLSGKANVSHTHTKEQITDFPTDLVTNDTLANYVTSTSLSSQLSNYIRTNAASTTATANKLLYLDANGKLQATASNADKLGGVAASQYALKSDITSNNAFDSNGHLVSPAGWQLWITNET